MISSDIRRCVFILFLCAGTGWMSAQELRCTVTINSDQVEGSNKQMFATLQQSITEFVNSTKWTTLVFAEKERIECSMFILINSVTTDGLVDASLQLQSKRPVYGTSYSTPVLNIKDDRFAFRYQEYDRLDYQQTQFTTNLTSLLAYYCYLIIGYDIETYTRLGGTVCFQACEEIVNTARSSSMDNAEMDGWKYSSKLNRYLIINNLLDEAFKPFRNYLYEYHRLGLDIMSNNVGNGRAEIAQGFPVLREAYKARPASCLVAIFLDAKNDEIVSIFQKGLDAEKKSVLDVLSAVDPTRLNTVYEKINE